MGKQKRRRKDGKKEEDWRKTGWKTLGNKEREEKRRKTRGKEEEKRGRSDWRGQRRTEDKGNEDYKDGRKTTPKNRQSEGIKTRAEIKEGGRDNGGKQRGISDGEQNKKEQQEEERRREGSEWTRTRRRTEDGREDGRSEHAFILRSRGAFSADVRIETPRTRTEYSPCWLTTTS